MDWMGRRQRRRLIFYCGLSLICLVELKRPLWAADAAQRAYQKGDYQTALRRYERVLKDHPEWEAAHFGKGATLYKTNQLNEALLEFEKALSVKNPQQKAAVLYNLGNTLFQNGRVAESIQFYKRALELNPRDFDAKHNYELARLALQQQKQQQQPQSQQSKQDKQQAQPPNQAQAQRNEQQKRQKQQEAAQVLDALKQQEKQLMQERLRQQHPSLAKEKDW